MDAVKRAGTRLVWELVVVAFMGLIAFVLT